MMIGRSPYIHPEMAALLPWDLSIGPEAVDWANFGDGELLRMRAEADEMRERSPRPAPPLPRVRDLELPLGPQMLQARLYDPVGDGKLRPALVYLHGGGWCMGSIDSHDGNCRMLAKQSRINVLSIDYPLAPESKFPTALGRITDACRWLRRKGREWNIDPDRIAIGGDSAGANLALSTAMQLRDSGQHFLRGLLLLYGVFAHDHDTESHRQLGRDERYTLSSAAMDFCWRMYLENPAQDRDARAAPLLGDLHRLPPAHLVCGSLDPLLDDSIRLHEKLRAAGAPSELDIVSGVTHSFLSFFDKLEPARKAWRGAADFLEQKLEP
jgi:acetyl esterase